MDKIVRLVARAEIQDNMCRYTRGVDRRDWPVVRACYHDDAIDEHGDYSGDADGFIKWVSVRHAQIPFSAHFLGNCLIEFVDEKTAVVETYFHVMRRNPGKGGAEGSDVDMIGRYLDRFEKRNGEWRVARRKVVADATRMRTAPMIEMKRAPSVGSRDRSDPLYEWREKAGLPGL